MIRCRVRRGGGGIADETQLGAGCWDEVNWVGNWVDDVEISTAVANQHLVGLLLEKYNNGEWHATDICRLA